MTALEVMVTRNCNLKCKYCYEGGNKTSQAMSPGILRKAIETFKPTTLTFFGGEPLLNRYLIKYGINIGKHNGVKNFKIVTNGTLITPDFLKSVQNENLTFTVSLDGIKEAHNKNRGNFDLVIEGVNLLRKYKTPYLFRATITPETVPFAFESIKFLIENEPLGIQMQLADSGSCSFSEDDYYNYEIELNKIKEYYLQLKEKQGVPHLSIGQSVNCDKPYCGAGVTYLCVDYDGGIYPCHRAVFIPNTKMGHVDTGIDIYKANCYSRVKRSDLKCDPLCPIINNCNGSCYIANFFSNGNFYFPDRVICKMKTIYARVGGNIV